MGSFLSQGAQSNSPSAFETLPYEIREQIWLETLVPRLIYIHPHRRIAPPFYDPQSDEILDSKRHTISVRFNCSLHSQSATPAQAFADYASFAAPNLPKVDRMDGDSLTFDDILAKQPLTYKSTDPPAALYVCQESRAIALRRGYVLAFKGVDLRLEAEDRKYWQKNHLGDKGVWIDFEHDLIMLDALYRPWMYSKCAPHEPLVLLHKFAPGDVKRIKRLALGGNPGGILRALRGNCIPVSHGQRWRTAWQWWVGMGFDNLEEIWIDDEFEDKRDEQWDGWHSQKDAEAQYHNVLGLGKSKLPNCTSPVPQVKVFRGEEWHAHF
ncbi:uncharacterized protein PAC_16380 [Phialocephala subalpina]|uniref:2EXR domain-containing protein n=1 Tax=Phialocephala subalpina TaxID=576137 RepID=A0A1L7XN61_9HELO|nr:uncharacterized protein PAC_16380 [Phialocephala subalpina]